MPEYRVKNTKDESTTIFLPESSEWLCYMFGNTTKLNYGYVYHPVKGNVPNWFVRWMMKLCFACTWIKEADIP